MVDESSRPPWWVWLHPRWWCLLKRWRQAVRRWRNLREDHFGWELDLRYYNGVILVPPGTWSIRAPVGGWYPHQVCMPDDLKAALVTMRLCEPHRYNRITQNWSSYE